MAKNIKNKSSNAKKGLKGPAAIVFIVIVCTILVIYAISQFVVLGWGLMTSLKADIEFQFSTIKFPDINGTSKETFWGLKHYANLVNFTLKPSGGYYSMGREITYETEVNFLGMLGNSILYMSIAGIMVTFVPCIVAYMCSKYKFFFSKVITAIVVAILSFHIIGAEPAAVRLLRDLGLYDSFFGMAVQHFTFLGMYYLVFLAFFDSLSDGYMEAAEIDGASQFRILVSIALPLAAKMISTVFLIRAIGFWNDYNTPLLYLPSKPTLAYGIWKARESSNSADGLNSVPAKVACGMILAIPMTIIFIVFKDKLMGNITMGGMKE